MEEKSQISKILRFIQPKPKSLAGIIEEEEVVVVCICPASALVLDKYMKGYKELQNAVRIKSSPKNLKEDFLKVAGTRLLETNPESYIFLLYYPMSARDRVYDTTLAPR